MDVVLRACSVADSPMLFEWRNSIEARRYSTNQSVISAHEHNKWIASRFGSGNQDPFWIATINGVPIGYVRCDANESNGSSFEVSIFLTSDFRHSGLGKKSLAVALQYLHDDYPGCEITATVHRENERSLKLFSRLGFRLKKSQGDFDVFSLRFE